MKSILYLRLAVYTQMLCELFEQQESHRWI